MHTHVPTRTCTHTHTSAHTCRKRSFSTPDQILRPYISRHSATIYVSPLLQTMTFLMAETILFTSISPLPRIVSTHIRNSTKRSLENQRKLRHPSLDWCRPAQWPVVPAVSRKSAKTSDSDLLCFWLFGSAHPQRTKETHLQKAGGHPGLRWLPCIPRHSVPGF